MSCNAPHRTMRISRPLRRRLRAPWNPPPRHPTRRARPPSSGTPGPALPPSPSKSPRNRGSRLYPIARARVDQGIRWRVIREVRLRRKGVRGGSSSRPRADQDTRRSATGRTSITPHRTERGQAQAYAPRPADRPYYDTGPSYGPEQYGWRNPYQSYGYYPYRTQPQWYSYRPQYHRGGGSRSSMDTKGSMDGPRKDNEFDSPPPPSRPCSAKTGVFV